MLTILKHRHAGTALKLEETPLKHILWADDLDLHQIQHHVVPQMKRRIQPVRLSFDHVLRRWRLQLLIAHHDHNSPVIQSSPPRSPRHLNIFTTRKISELSPVELPRCGEDDRLGGHVQTDGERLGGEESFNETFLEENFDDFFEDGEQPSVMDADATLEEREDVRDLWEGAVIRGERCYRVFEDFGNGELFVGGVELELGELEGEGFAFAFAEGEDNDGVVVLQHDHADDFGDVRGACVVSHLAQALGVGRVNEAHTFLVSSLLRLALPSGTAFRVCRILSLARLKHTHRFREHILPKLALLI